jgi:hypothetical protein
MKTISGRRLSLVLAIGLIAGCIHRQPGRSNRGGFYRIEECKEPEAQAVLTFAYGIDGVFHRSPNVFYFRKQSMQTAPGEFTRAGQGCAIRFVNADSPDRWTNTGIKACNIDETGVTISTTCSYSGNGRRGEVNEVNQDIRITWGQNAKGKIDKFNYEAKWQGTM